MRYATEAITSVGELLTKLKGHIGDFGGPLWYRGHSQSGWRLEPKLLRIADRLPETHYLNRFRQDATFILKDKPNTEFDWLFLMQHYGIATRLLDWSESPLTALYFACVNDPGVDGAIWMLLPTVLNSKSRYLSEYEHEIPSFSDEHLTNYKPSIISGERKSSLLPMAAIAPRNSTRMQAQKGVFTISHRDNIIIEAAGNVPFDHVWKYEITSGSKVTILEELKILGINRFHLFPELESLSYNF